MCEYCEDGQELIDVHDWEGNRHLAAWIENGLLVAESDHGSDMMHDSVAINNCPMCGRDLRGDAE